MTEAATGAAAPDSELIPVTATRGFPYISSRAEAEIAGTIVLEMIAAHIAEVDAVVIAAYGDPGLYAARELFDLPVVGMAEAAMLTACMLGSQFSLVTFSEDLVPWYRESLTVAGLSSRLASIRVPPAEFKSVINVQSELRAPLYTEVTAAAEQDGADVVILGGAPLAGLAGQLSDAPAVLVDPVSAAVKQAEALVCVAPRGAYAGSMKRPPAKINSGIDARLGEWIAKSGH